MNVPHGGGGDLFLGGPGDQQRMRRLHNMHSNAHWFITFIET